jgi:hypothetical protein
VRSEQLHVQVGETTAVIHGGTHGGLEIARQWEKKKRRQCRKINKHDTGVTEGDRKSGLNSWDNATEFHRRERSDSEGGSLGYVGIRLQQDI